MPLPPFDEIVALYRRGQVAACKNHCNAYIKGKAKDARPYHLLSHIFITEGQFKQAEKIIKSGLKAVKDKKHLAMLWDIYGQWAELHAPKSVASHYKKAIAADKDNADYPLHLAKFYGKAGEADAARQAYAATLDRHPNHNEALNGLGLLALDEDDFATAEQCFRTAIANDDNYHPAWLNLSHVALEYTDSADQAIAHAEKAIGLLADNSPSLVPYRMTLAKHYGALGDGNKAADHYLLAAEKDAGRYMGDIYFSAARYQPNKDMLKPINEKLTLPLSQQQKALLFFAKAKIYDAVKEDEAAEDNYMEANRLLHNENASRYLNDMRKYVSDLKTAFAEVELHDKGGDKKTNPIFIVGTMRCGSSLLEQILANHSDIAATGEVNHFANAMKQLASHHQCSVREPQKLLSQATPESKKHAAEFYLQRLSYFCQPSSPPYITDKQLDNFFHVGWIRLLLPSAKIIWCRRSPADAALSIFCNYFASAAHPYAYDIKAIAEFFDLHNELMEFWQARCGDRLHILDYENLVTDTEACLQNLLDYLSLPMQADMLNFATSRRPVQTASSAEVRHAIHSTSVGKMARFPKILKAWQEFNR